MSTVTWKVLQHGAIERLAENLWRVEGAIPRMSLRRVMTVARRSDGRLVIHSAIAMDDERMRELEALGRPSVMLVPNAMHRLDAPAYKQRYPELKVFAPRASRQKVAEVVEVDGAYEDFPPDEAVQLHTLEGTCGQEGVMIVRSADGTSLIINDVVMNMDKKSDFLGWLFTTLMGSAPGPRISRLAKLVLVKDKAKLREELTRYAELPDLVRLVVSHEKVSEGADARAALRQAMTYLPAR